MVSAGSTALQRRAPAEGLAAPDNVGRPPAREGAVLVYSRGVYPAQLGGREVFVADLVRGLAERGRNVVLLTERDPGIDEPGVRIAEAPTHEIPGIGFVLFAIGAFRALLARRSEVEWIHAHSPRANVSLAGFLASFFGKKLVVTAHCRGVDYAFSSFAYDVAARVVAVSASIAENLVEAGVSPDKIEVIPCVPRFPPAPASREEARQALGLPLSGFVVLYLGRIDLHKGVQLLVDALRHWPPGRPVRALFVGDGPARAHLENSLLARPDIEVTWVGRVDHAEVGIYYRAADVFVLPSLAEGSPLSIFEALHYGTPIVSCDAPGLRDFLQDRVNAILVPRSSEGVQRGLLDLYGDPRLRESLSHPSGPRVAFDHVIDLHLRLYGTKESRFDPERAVSNTTFDPRPPTGDSHG